MSSRPFNTSTKQPTSVKLRGLKASKAVTQQLEVDSRRMEERLRELKLTMNREKEERESRGSSSLGIWASGKPGAMTTHTNELSKKKKSLGPPMPGQTQKPKSGNKVRKIKVLKDSPIELPQRTKFKMNSVPSGDTRKSFKGPPCGQCEEKAVALTCMECGENYCTGCYARFHMRGALKNHRSIPYQSPSASTESIQRPYENGVHSPRSTIAPPPPSSGRKSSTGADSHNPRQQKVVRVMVKSPAPSSTGGALLQGDYDEQESAAGFAAALAEWRQTKQPEGAAAVKVAPSTSPRGTSTTEGTSTANDNLSPRQIEINFTENSTLSYADRLLLKKHRRTELPEAPSPALVAGNGASKEIKQQENVMKKGEMVNGDDGKEDEQVMVNGEIHFSDNEDLEDEHQRYMNIFSKRVVQSTTPPTRPESSLSISEVTEDDERRHLEEAVNYSVQEDPDDEPVIEHINNNNKQLSNNTKGSKSSSSAATNEKSSLQEKKPQSSTTRKTSGNPPKTPTSEKTKSQPLTSSKSRTQSRSSSSKPPGSGRTPKTSKDARESNTKSRSQSRSDASKPRIPQQSIASKPASAKTGATSARPKSKGSSSSTSSSGRNGGDEMCNTPTQQERPASVGLTTRPSDGLVQASQHTWQPQHKYKEGLSEFFMAGLTGEDNPGSSEQSNRSSSSPRSSVTPTNELPECSFQGTSAWRPDSSLAATPDKSSQKSYSPAPPSRPSSGARTPSKTRHVKSPVKQQIDRNPETGTPIQNSSCLMWRNNRSSGGALENEESATHLDLEDRSSSRIEVDGKDMTEFDEDALLTGREVSADDRETLEQLTWELASHEGRITADGRISSMSLLNDNNNDDNREAFSHDAELGILQDDGHGSGLSTPCGDLMMEQDQLSEEDLQSDFEDNRHCKEEVQALV